MNGIPFFTRFKRYMPSDELVRELEGCIVTKTDADTQKRAVRCYVDCKKVFTKTFLHSVENDIKKAYDLNIVELCPHYPSELFSEEYLPELWYELRRRKIITNGFVDSGSINYDEENKLCTIAVNYDGKDMLEDSGIKEALSQIIKDEFDLLVRVNLCDGRSYSEADYAYKAQMEEHYKKLIAEDISRLEAYAPPVLSGDAPNKCKSVEGDIDGEEIIDFGDNKVKTGYLTADLTDPSAVIGEIHNGQKLLPISRISENSKRFCTFGQIYSFDFKENRDGTKFMLTVGITDKRCSISVKMSVLKETLPEPKKALSVGDVILVEGSATRDKDRFGNILDVSIRATAIAKVKIVHRADTAEKKRVELHLHTKMSALDALIAPEEVADMAKEWNWPAIAVTDHGNVQAYPIIAKRAKKLGQKIIYGIECYFVDDTARAVFGDDDASFSEGSFTVFDIETTGLSTMNCGITEIGAVRLEKGEVTDVFCTYVDPKMHIPENITKLTGISDDMVAGAPDEATAVADFLKFAQGSVLIAHNANFDMGFIRKVCSENQYNFFPTYIDTVAVSRYLNKDLKKHTLDSIGAYYDLGDFNHHRASDDAQMLCAIFKKMTEKLEGEGINDIYSLNREMAKHADPKALNTNHMVLLVKDGTGLKNLYKLISSSYLDYFNKHPRIPKTLLNEHREGLIVGGACEQGEVFKAIMSNRSFEDICEIADYYDYLEIQPICNNSFYIDEGAVENEEQLRELNRTVLKVGDKIGKPVCATCDAHYLEDCDEIGRKILMYSQGFKDADRSHGLYLRTTDEMLEEFSYLGDRAYEVVVENTNKIADMIGDVSPIPAGTFPPDLPGCKEELENMCYEKAYRMYGNPLPELVKSRLQRELDPIKRHGFSVMYAIAQKLVAKSESLGYYVGSRGSVGSSFVACMSNITEVNALPPHYLCPECKYSEFIVDGTVGSGFDLPEKMCPVCGTKLVGDGHDIPFETFLGFDGDKEPDIDLNFSGEVQGECHKYTEVLFGKDNVFRAGTISAYADKTAYGIVKKYLEGHGIEATQAEIDHLCSLCMNVKKTTGQHPGGIIVVPRDKEVYDFTPIQHPPKKGNTESDVITTHFAFEYLHDTLLKLDMLGHDVPTKYRVLQDMTGVDAMHAKVPDEKVMALLQSTAPLGVSPEDIRSNVGTFGLPELGTKFVRGMIEESKPKTFADLLQISGLSHGTDVWLGNAQDLVKDGVCTISEVIGTRDNIMTYLIYRGLEKLTAFKIMEDVRKGRGLKPEYEQIMIENNIPEWYIASCKKIKYMFPKAHAAAYVIAALRLGWYKVYYPVEFYCCYFTVQPEGFDYNIVKKGRKAILSEIDRLEALGKEATGKDEDTIAALYIVNELLARGIKILPPSIEHSEAKTFKPENGCIRVPFTSLAGLGESAAISIVEARNDGEILSVEDLKLKTKLSGTLIELLRESGALEGIPETNQLSFFDLI